MTKNCRYIAGRWKCDLKSLLRVDSVWSVILHWWCLTEREASWDENAFMDQFLLAACPRILQMYAVPKCTLQLTTALSSIWFIALLIHSYIYCIQCWNYALLNKNKQAEWMKSSDLLALIIPIRFLSSSLSPSVFLHLTASPVEWVVASGRTMIDTSLLCAEYAKWASFIQRDDAEGGKKQRRFKPKRKKDKKDVSLS